MKKNLINNPFFYSFFFTLISLVVHRYSYGIGDQAIHIPLITKAVDNTFYQNDLLFTAGQGNLSLFYNILAFFVGSLRIPIEFLFFLGYIVIFFLLYRVLYLIGNYYFRKEYWLMVLLGVFFLVPVQVGGTATSTIDISFVPRLIAFVLSLYALYFFLTDKISLTFFFLAVIFAVHPISFLYIFLILTVMAGFYNKNISLKSLAIFIFCFLIINYPLLVNIYHSFGMNIAPDNQNWIKILRSRNFYVFLDLWEYKAWLSLFLIASPSIYYIFLHKKKNTKLLRLVKVIVSVCVLITIAHYFLAYLPFVTKLQLPRIWVFAYLSSAIALTAILSSLKINIRKFSLLFIFTLLVFSFYIHKKWYYTQNNYWINVQSWVSENTGRDCIFLTPYNHQGFRVYAKRSIVGEYKDGTLSFYSPVFAQEWDNRAGSLKSWEKLDSARLINLQNIYNFSYLVILSSQNIAFKEVYNNSVYAVYQMPTLAGNCSKF